MKTQNFDRLNFTYGFGVWFAVVACCGGLLCLSGTSLWWLVFVFSSQRTQMRRYDEYIQFENRQQRLLSLHVDLNLMTLNTCSKGYIISLSHHFGLRWRFWFSVVYGQHETMWVPQNGYLIQLTISTPLVWYGLFVVKSKFTWLLWRRFKFLGPHVITCVRFSLLIQVHARSINLYMSNLWN